jgi:hypothetical protein
MTERYETSESYEDEGSVEVMSVADREPQKTSHVHAKFRTIFERSSNAFRFDQTEEYDGFENDKPVTGKRQATMWRNGSGSVRLWSSQNGQVATVGFVDAAAELAGAGEASFRVPMLLIEQKRIFLGPTTFTEGPGGRPEIPEAKDFGFRVEGEETVRGTACVKLVSEWDAGAIALWVGAKDHAIWRVTERLRRTAMPGAIEYGIAHLSPTLSAEERKAQMDRIKRPASTRYEATIDYTPHFDVDLKRARFEFNPEGAKTPVDRCGGKTAVAEGKEPLVDDVEDGDIFIRLVDHRVGRWWVFGDQYCAISPTFPHADSPGGRNESRFAMHLGAHDCGPYGFGLGFALNDVTGRCGYDASVYDGVYFWGRSGKDAVTARFKVGTRQTQPREYGGDGTCDDEVPPKCWDQPSAAIELGSDWKQYALRWADLKQSGWGKEVAFDPKQLTSLVLSTSTIPAAFREIWIDQVGFFKGDPPPSPFSNP